MDPSEITIKDIDKIETGEISDQIIIRRHLIKQMVGNVYPNILYGEIQTLIKRQDIRSYIEDQD